MNYKVIRTLNFLNQLDQILDYIKASFSQEQSLEYLSYLEEQIEELKEFPNLGKKISLKTSFIKPTNAFISKKNIVFYRINEKEKTIILITICHSNENYLNLMN